MKGKSFTDLASLRDALPAGPEPAPVAAPPPPKGPARAVLRYERKGHGGKEVTRVEQLDLPAPRLEEWCRDLKRDLGIGGFVDGDALVLSGDQRKRLPALLAERGVRKVTGG